jgi:hypothetical protein
MARVSNIDDDLLETAANYFPGFPSPEAAAINVALKDLIEKHKKGIEDLLALQGTIVFDDEYDPPENLVLSAKTHENPQTLS